MDALFVSGGARAALLSSNGGTAPALRQAATLYPNPATDVVNVNMTKKATGAYSVSVYDLRGHQMTGVRTNSAGQLEVASLPKGLYYIRIANGGEVTHQRFEKE
jgi:hypothetical protein